MSKHTPGPWKLDGMNILTEDGWYIAELDCDYVGNKSTAEADGRLIAAAPQLLDALKASSAFVHAYHEVDRRGRAPRIDLCSFELCCKNVASLTAAESGSVETD